MDSEKFSSEIQTWMLESGAVKELKTRLRKEMYDLLLARKTKNINVVNDKSSKKCVSEFDLAMNLLIVEHLMKKGLWYTASVMVSEAEFLEEPPEIEVVTSTKKCQNSDRVQEYKRQSPAKLSDETVARAFAHVLDLDPKGLVDQVMVDYYRQRDASVLSLMLKYLNQDIKNREELDLIKQKVPETPAVPEKVEPPSPKKSEKSPKKKVRPEIRSTASSSTTTEDYSEEKVRKKRSKKSSKHSNDADDDKDRILRQLQKELLDARCEMQSLAESKVRLANFQAVIETQTFTIDELRNEVRLLRSRQNVLSDKMSETKVSEGNLSENKIHNFVSHIKSTVDELGLASQAIDSEFAAI